MLASEMIERLEELTEIIGGDPEVVIETKEGFCEEAGADIQNCIAGSGRDTWTISDAANCDTQVIKVY